MKAPASPSPMNRPRYCSLNSATGRWYCRPSAQNAPATVTATSTTPSTTRGAPPRLRNFGRTSVIADRGARSRRRLRVHREQLLLNLIHPRLPDVALLVEADRARMVRDRGVRIDRAVLRPLLEHRMDRHELLAAFPHRLQRRLDDLIGHGLAGEEVRVVGDDAGVLDDARDRAGLDDPRIVAGYGLLHARLAVRRAIVRNVAHADGGVGLLDLRRVERVLRDVGPTLQERVDAVVDGVDGNDLHVAPGEPRAGEMTEHVVPDRQVRAVLAGEALALDVVDVLDRRLLAHEEPDHQRRAAHHEPHVRRVRERIPAADLVGGSAVGEPQIDAVLDAELHLTAIDERQHRAGAGVRLYDHLVTGRPTHHLGDAAAEREVHGSGRVGADGDRFGQRALRGGADGERTGGEGHD